MCLAAKVKQSQSLSEVHLGVKSLQHDAGLDAYMLRPFGAHYCESVCCITLDITEETWLLTDVHQN